MLASVPSSADISLNGQWINPSSLGSSLLIGIALKNNFLYFCCSFFMLCSLCLLTLSGCRALNFSDARLLLALRFGVNSLGGMDYPITVVQISYMLQCDRFELNLKRRGQLHKQATSLVVYVIYVYRRKSLYVGAVSYTTYKLQSK